MLSLQPLDSADGAASYYLDVVNYYENDSKSVRWLGDGAKILGIHGQTVEKEQMLALLKGTLPDGTQLGRIDKDGVHHRPGFDMTLTAPKSFSILLESGADPRLGEVFDKAVEWFVEEMEKEFAQARQLVDGKIEYIDTKNLVIAAFRQPSSRANDPNSHTHLVVQNMTHCPDGKWRSLASDMDSQKGVVEQIMKHHIYGGLKFRNKLANLTKELGYQLVSDGDGLWEIQGAPEQVLTHFSKRRESIEALLDEKGWSGAKASSIAAQKTKLDKEIIDYDQWKEDIIKECQEMGFDPHQLVASSYKPQQNLFQTLKENIIERFYGKDNIEMNHARESVYVAIESISQQQAVFEERELKKEALKYVIASNKIIDETLINKAIAENIADQNLYTAKHPFTQKPLLTTPWQLTLESEAIQRIENGKGAVSAICSKQKVNDFIKAKEQEMAFALSPSQKKAMTTFLTSTDRFIAIQGYAGTGKTTMLRLTRELASLQGYELRGITAGSAAANELRHKGGLNASTFARELGRLQNQQQDLSKTIFVVDEASMLSNPQGHKIIKLAEQFNTQLKIIGDKAQLPAPSSGKLFSVIQDYGIKTVAMTDNLRQKDMELKESAIHAGRGEIYDAVEKLTFVKTADTYLKRVDYLASKWLSFTPEERQNTLCFAPTHKNRQDITLILRNTLIKEGALTGQEHLQPILKERNLTSIKLRNAAYYSQNDIIRFNNTNPRYNIKAGDYLTVGLVTNAHKKNNTLSLNRENGQTITFKLSSLPEFKTENKDLERPVEIYRQEMLSIMAGDQIQWKRNSEDKGIRNSELATIKEITKEAIIITTEDNQTLHLQHQAKELRHIDHGYVLTTYATQGKDKKRGLGLIESFNRFASTIQNYYVETTRGICEMIVVTDDKEHLVKAITTNESDKYSSMDMVGSATLKAHETRFKDHKNSFALQNAIEKKLSKEQGWKDLEHTVESYLQCKQQGQERKAAKLAYTIVNDQKLYRLAKERLGFSVSTYRREALRFQTSKLFHSLPVSERQHFSTVRHYVALNQQILKRSQHIKAHELEQGIENDISNQNKRDLQQLTAKRNSLAFLISKDLEHYKPYLQHFSIGELNRIGLPQHEYGKEIKKAQSRLESLGKHATRDLIRTNVSLYLNAHGEEKEKLAAQIKREAKSSHAFVLTHAKELKQKPETLWMSINNDARFHADRLFRNGLNAEGRLAFDNFKAYKTLQLELRESWSASLKEAEKGTANSVNLKSIELLTSRNALAHELMQNKGTPEIAAYFKLDLAKLTAQKEKHQYSENIKQFMASKGNFKTRLAAINEIKNDIKGHYPFIKESHLDTKIISKYLRVTDRLERLSNLSSAEKKDYRYFLSYKMASTQAYRHWQQVHCNKANGNLQNNKLISEAITHSSKRDYLAHQLKDSPFLDLILSYEKGNKEKLLTQAGNHQIKLREIKDLNEVMHTLSTQYVSITNADSVKAVSAWKKNWSSLCSHINQIEQGKGYQLALQEYPLNVVSVKAINKDLETLYDFKPEIIAQKSDQSVNPVLQKLQKSSQFLDARIINESLMVNPENTYTAIWGEPKTKTSRELRYDGGLIVTLKGKDKGLWHDFSDGVGGAPIQAIMKRDNLSFKEALSQTATLAGIHQLDAPFNKIKPSKVNQLELQKSSDTERRNKIISAKSIWDSSVQAKGTLAEKYLKQHRGIAAIDKLDVRFWPAGSQWRNCNEDGILEDKINKIPALIIAARNEKSEITGVQRIYLDSKTASKNKFMDKPKLSKGIIEGSCGIIQKGMQGSPLYVAEGFETGASIAIADSKATVLCSFGVSNMKNLSPIIKKYNAKEIIIAGDNDGNFAKSQQAVEKTIVTYKQNNLNARAVFPNMLPGKVKTDWNDIHLNKGIAELQKQLVNKDIGSTLSTPIKPITIPERIANIAQLKSMKLNDSQITAIRENTAIVDNSRNINQLVAAYNRSNQAIEKTSSFTAGKVQSIKINREVDMEL
ncbi:TPA: conjugative transfer relaxase/helicase TraI [Legionella pneumophila]|nr:conjugative transfer relaxase/helicase TraI [Legionella pneumophila]HCJ1112872.1 conjugative transfer relaxase/helicase TraI [Legionella pneumophila]